MKKVLFVFLLSMTFAFVASASNSIPGIQNVTAKNFKTQLHKKIIKDVDLSLNKKITIIVDEYCSCWAIQIYVNGYVIGTMTGCGCAVSEKAFYDILELTAHG